MAFFGLFGKKKKEKPHKKLKGAGGLAASSPSRAPPPPPAPPVPPPAAVVQPLQSNGGNTFMAMDSIREESLYTKTGFDTTAPRKTTTTTTTEQQPHMPAPSPTTVPPTPQTVRDYEANQAAIDLTRSLVKRFIADIWNRGEVDLIPEVCSPSLRFNGNTGFDRVGHEGLARMVNTIREALDDYHCEIHSMVVEHNKAFCRLRFTGTSMHFSQFCHQCHPTPVIFHVFFFSSMAI